MGKSSLALAVARRLGGEIVNADALQVYRGFDLGTAKPSVEERREVPHHLVDILEPTETYSAAEFARRAHPLLREIAARGALPIVVGGSGLYVRTLLEGISPIPGTDPDLRRWLSGRVEEEGLGGSRRALRLLDPRLAARLEPGDTQRILRGVEVALGTGRPLSDWQQLEPIREQRLVGPLVGLTLPREVLYDRIASRVRQMLEDGWLEEVEGLLRSGLRRDVPAFQAIGYRQLARHLVEGGGLDRAVEEIILATRRFAKRQLTWFRKQRSVSWISGSSPEISLARTLELLELP